MPNPFPLAATLALATTASAVPNYGHEWRTIGDPGNAPTNPAELHPSFPRPLGAVDYEYRLMRTEVTNTQQLEFLNAYTPYIQDSDRRSWGDISYLGGTWSLRDGRENRPGDMSPRLWARYANWLHNGKALTQDAFESGAYDTSTFGEDEDGNPTDQLTRSPGARFWIPSLDEWIKGGYYDPNRFGDGEGGYWLFPNSSDNELVSGPPEDGGETNAGLVPGRPLDVGSYPDTQTPWGLLDYSGGESELAERLILNQPWFLVGTSHGDRPTRDRLGRPPGIAFETLGGQSVRLASAIPAPSATALLLLGVPYATRRRR